MERETLAIFSGNLITKMYDLYHKLLGSRLLVKLLTGVTVTWLTKALPEDSKLKLALQENVVLRKKLENSENQRWKLEEKMFSLMQKNRLVAARLVEIEKETEECCRKSGTEKENKSTKDHDEIKGDRFESQIKESQHKMKMLSDGHQNYLTQKESLNLENQIKDHSL